MISIAIDGPSGSGKTTLAMALAKYFGINYLNTGALYRAMAVFCFDNKIVKEKDVEAAINYINVTVKYIDGQQCTYLNGKCVDSLLRNEKIGMLSSKISSYPCVRLKLLETQRNIIKKNSIVMDGRDIGTVIMPKATAKLYITATSAVRAKRRYDELIAKGVQADIEKIHDDIMKRDYIDINKKISPLRCAADAVIVDTSLLTVKQVVNRCIKIVEEKIQLSQKKKR